MKQIFDEPTFSWLQEPDKKRANNEKLFSIVASRYDLVTKILSFGRDELWKKKLIAFLPTLQAPLCVDIACGTGDLSFLLAEKYPQGSILGIDITAAMLELARLKNCFHNVSFSQQDMNNLAMVDSSVDVVTGGYALRNAPDLNKALSEISRVLKSGGVAIFLDFSKPSGWIIRSLGYGILKAWGSFWGIMLHGDYRVYAYIAESLKTFPDRISLRILLNNHGLRLIRTKFFFGGMLELIMICKDKA